MAIVNQQLDDLPPGVTVAPGEIVVRFRRPEEALRKLLAIAMAAGNDLEGFERRIRLAEPIPRSDAESQETRS